MQEYYNSIRIIKTIIKDNYILSRKTKMNNLTKQQNCTCFKILIVSDLFRNYNSFIDKDNINLYLLKFPTEINFFYYNCQIL